MTEFFTFNALTAIALILGLAALAKNGKRLKPIIRTSEFILVANAMLASIALVLMYTGALPDKMIVGNDDLGHLFRLDKLSASMLFMVQIIGFVVVRFSKAYLLGDSNQNKFIQRLLITIAFVQLLVMSGSLITLVLTWIGTSVALHYLLVFYNDRETAVRAARKKSIISRLSDLCLISGSALLYIEFQSLNLETIFEGLRVAESNLYIEAAAGLIVLAAILKSAQIPFHGWLLDVMEAPTPVSGLLHAGLLNAGPFLIIRFAYLMDVSTFGPVLLLAVGGATAIYGTIVYPTQAAVKTGLAYSSVAHMGFSLMTCGLGLYSASLLHLMAHSFYKAHSFLSSGSLIDKYRLARFRGFESSKVTPAFIAIGTALAVGMYFGLSAIWGGEHGFQMHILGAIIVIGVSTYLIRSLSNAREMYSIFFSILSGCVILALFFLLEHFYGYLLGAEIPSLTEPNDMFSILTISLVALFAFTALTSLMKGSGNKLHKWEVYKRNGFYMHILFDRILESNKTNLNINLK